MLRSNKLPLSHHIHTIRSHSHSRIHTLYPTTLSRNPPSQILNPISLPRPEGGDGNGGTSDGLEDGHRSKNDRKRLPYWTTEAEAEPVRLELAGHVKKLMRRNWCCETDAVEAHRRPSCYKNTKCTLNKPKQQLKHIKVDNFLSESINLIITMLENMNSKQFCKTWTSGHVLLVQRDN
jgi:hypothetical protein